MEATEKVTPATLKKYFSMYSGTGKGSRKLHLQNTVKAFSKKNEIPIAVIKREIFGASLKGLYAILSINIPKAADNVTANRTVTGNDKSNTAINV